MRPSGGRGAAPTKGLCGVSGEPSSVFDFNLAFGPSGSREVDGGQTAVLICGEVGFISRFRFESVLLPVEGRRYRSS